MAVKFISKFILTGKKMEIIHISTKGQIVIPEEVRKRIGIKPGSKLVLLEKDGTILLKKEEDVAKILEDKEYEETIGWMAIAEQSLKEIWDNPKDEKVWKKYL